MTCERTGELRCTASAPTSQTPGTSKPPGPRHWSLTDRLPANDVQKTHSQRSPAAALRAAERWPRDSSAHQSPAWRHSRARRDGARSDSTTTRPRSNHGGPLLVVGSDSVDSGVGVPRRSKGEDHDRRGDRHAACDDLHVPQIHTRHRAWWSRSVPQHVRTASGGCRVPD